MADSSVSSSRMLNISFNMILLVFFVYLNTIGEYEESRIKKALGSMIGTFGMVQGGVNITKGKKLMLKGPPMIGPIKEPINIAAMLKQYIREKQIEDQVSISRKGKDVVINFSDRILFDSGSAELREEAKELIGSIATALEQTSHPIRIEGHTDNVPISTDRYPSNWELSTARAVAVLRFLMEEYQIPPERLIAMGFGEYRPIVPNDTPEHRARNRRVSIILVGKGNKDG